MLDYKLRCEWRIADSLHHKCKRTQRLIYLRINSSPTLLPSKVSSCDGAPAHAVSVILSQARSIFARQDHQLTTRRLIKAQEKQYPYLVDSSRVLLYLSTGLNSYVPQNPEDLQNLKHEDLGWCCLLTAKASQQACTTKNFSRKKNHATTEEEL